MAAGGLCFVWHILAKDQLLCHKDSFFFDLVHTTVTGTLTSVLCHVLSGIRNMLLLRKGTRQQGMYFTMQSKSSAVSTKKAQMQFTSDYS